MNKRFLKVSSRIYGIIILVMLLMVCVETVGAQEQNATTAATETVTPKYNVLKLSPIAALDIGFGFGAGYERLFGQSKNFGLTLPFYLVLENTSDGNNNLTAGTTGKGTSYNTYFYFMPGFKFYPGGHNRVTYALGPSLLFGFGNNKTTQIAFDAMGQQTFETVKYARKRFGVLMNNYVTFGIGKAFDLGLEGGLGICYFDKESYNGSEYYPSSSESKGFDLAGQFSLSISYKF